MRTIVVAIGLSLLALSTRLDADDGPRAYENKLSRIQHPKPLLADYPEWVEPIREKNRWEAPAIVMDSGHSPVFTRS